MSGGLLDVDRALEMVLERCVVLDHEEVGAADADRRYLSVSCVAQIDLPPFTNSAMDGYAVRAQDTPGTLEIVGESAAGRPCRAGLFPGQAITISTGAVLPEGADAVVPIEVVHATGAAESGLDLIDVADAVSADANVRHRGSDVRAGAEVLSAGVRIGPAQLGAAIAAGAGTLTCARQPRVAILTTGDELRRPGQTLADGEIYDSNGPMLAALLRRAGARVENLGAAEDTRDAHRRALQAALEYDVVISTGGVSVGPHDLVRGVGAELGVEEVFWRVKMRPGKPLAFGVRERTLVFGLPGNPVAVLVCAQLFVAPALAALQGATLPAPGFIAAPLAVSWRGNPERDDFIRVTRDPDGGLVPVDGQGSHQLALAAHADGLARIPTGAGVVPRGTAVPYLPLPR